MKREATAYREVGRCPKCQSVIADTNPYGWCVKCGEPLPPEIVSQLAIWPALQQSAAECDVAGLCSRCKQARLVEVKSRRSRSRCRSRWPGSPSRLSCSWWFLPARRARSRPRVSAFSGMSRCCLSAQQQERHCGRRGNGSARAASRNQRSKLRTGYCSQRRPQPPARFARLAHGVFNGRKQSSAALSIPVAGKAGVRA